MNHDAFWNAICNTKPTYSYKGITCPSDNLLRRDTDDAADDDTLDLSALLQHINRIKVNVSEDADAYTVEAALSGVNKDAIELTVPEDKKLSIKVSEREKKTENFRKRITSEITTAFTERIVELPEEFDTEKISATFVDGLLTVTLPKIKKSPAKKISIS